MSLPAIPIAILAIVALALALRKPPPPHADGWLRVGTLALALLLCLMGFKYGLTDHKKVQHWPILARALGAASGGVGLMLLWQAVTGSTEQLRRMIDKTSVDSALVEKRAKIDGAFHEIQRWRVVLAIVGLCVIAMALGVVSHVAKTEPPSAEEHLGWLLFFVGLGATIPLLHSLFRALRNALNHAKGI